MRVWIRAGVGREIPTLSFDRPLPAAPLLAVLTGAMFSGDGRSKGFNGAQRIRVYPVMARVSFLMPDRVPNGVPLR